MKFLLASLTLWTAQAMAGECTSRYVFQPYGSCAIAANGPDLTKGEDLQAPNAEHRDNVTVKGSDQANVATQCENMRRKYDSDGPQHATRGVFTTSPIGWKQDHKDEVGQVTYSFYCNIKQVMYPYISKVNAQCPVTDSKWQSEPVAKQARTELPGAPLCLSCDESEDPAAAIKCLKTNLDTFVTPGNVIDIRPEDKAAMLNTVQQMLEVEKIAPNKDQILELLGLQKALTPAQ